MSIQRYCDGCGERIERNAVTERIEGTYEAPTGVIVNVTVTAGVGSGCWNSGDLCADCIVSAVVQAGQWAKAAEQRKVSSPPA